MPQTALQLSATEAMLIELAEERRLAAVDAASRAFQAATQVVVEARRDLPEGARVFFQRAHGGALVLIADTPDIAPPDGARS